MDKKNNDVELSKLKKKEKKLIKEIKQLAEEIAVLDSQRLDIGN